jgi:S-adenosyl-L-methionine hydrolase (adenosine-forming)
VARITLLTDFGTADGYVAAMKGVIAAIAPSFTVDDAAHDIQPGDIHAAAWALATYAFHYPAGSVHVVVVDPGVGSERRALAARIDGRYFVAPDNGLLTRALQRAAAPHVVAIGSSALLRASVSRTFHGRDIFAPTAAHIACGTALEALGPAIDDPVLLSLPDPSVAAGAVSGEVVHVDRFGNLITNIPEELAGAGLAVHVAAQEVRRVATYAEGAPGEVVALIGSAGVLEVAVRDGSAAAVLGAARGAAVLLSADA